MRASYASVKQRHVNVSAWLRDLITAELDRVLPLPTTDRPPEPSAPNGLMG